MAKKKIVWVPEHKIACGYDLDKFEIRHYDPANPPPGAPGHVAPVPDMPAKETK